MAPTRTVVIYLWMLSFVCLSVCWDLVPLKPVSCPESDEEDGFCYTMTHRQVRCVNFTIGPCKDIVESDSVRRYVGMNDLCLKVASGYCTQYSCRRACCNDIYSDDDDECETPYCDKHCENGGTCLWSMDGYNRVQKCSCPNPFYGDNCEKVKCRDDCENGGKCIIDGSETVCSCPEGYFGETCAYRDQDIPKACPKPTHHYGYWRHGHGHCRDECTESFGCGFGKICCHDGCCKKCIRPVYCFWNAEYYRPGEIVHDRNKSCQCERNGQMKCSPIPCPPITCPDVMEPVYKNGRWCPVCPSDDDHPPPTFRNCRNGETKQLPVRIYTGTAFSVDLLIKAYDYEWKPVKVSYSVNHRNHCKCTQSQMYPMVATATDDDGVTSTCEFFVVITDPYAPQYNSCPADIFAVEGEVITWNKPRANDNVGIRNQTCDTRNGQEFPCGEHTVTCTAVDFDDNKAYCHFTIFTYRSDTDESTMPPGLAYRKKKTFSSAYIIAATFSVIFIIILLVFIGCFIHRSRAIRQGRRGRGQRYAARPPIHTVGGDDLYSEMGKPPGFHLPPYSPKYEPPTYEDVQSGDADMTPPTYEAATSNGGAPTGSGRGYDNAAYELAGAVNQAQNPPTGDDIYEEIHIT